MPRNRISSQLKRCRAHLDAMDARPNDCHELLRLAALISWQLRYACAITTQPGKRGKRRRK